MIVDDSLAIKMLRTGTVNAFEPIIKRYQAPVFRYLCRLTGNSELSKDLAQDTFLRAYEGILKTRDDINLKAWLYKIATNNAYKHFRKAKIISFISLDHSRDVASPDEVEADISEQVVIRDAIQSVPLEMRTCLLMHLVDGFKYREIGLVLGISEEAVRKRVARGKKVFRKGYEGRR